MKRTSNILMSTFAAFLAVSLLLVVLFESGVLPAGVLAGNSSSEEFVVLCLMELLTICVIPVALRLFKFRRVASCLPKEGGLLRYGMLRLLALCMPMLANTLLYYLYMNVAFGYMGIILLLCLAFVLPTKERCEMESRRLDETPGNDVQHNKQ